MALWKFPPLPLGGNPIRGKGVEREQRTPLEALSLREAQGVFALLTDGFALQFFMIPKFRNSARKLRENRNNKMISGVILAGKRTVHNQLLEFAGDVNNEALQ
ncbi:hypothetical protein FJZ31_12320 [Candidatus Poribacteria bacterium]|nr:hypothetical protein [Candidatus Poribacteria bacterium]